MIVWRLYTESRPNLADIVARHFEGATLLSGTGLWQGKTENCTVIEIVTEGVENDADIAVYPGPEPAPVDEPRDIRNYVVLASNYPGPALTPGQRDAARRIQALAGDIARSNGQSAALVTRTEVVGGVLEFCTDSSHMVAA